jgi:S-adenosylmethionine:tRNA ribosyltransferase-isomerase
VRTADFNYNLPADLIAQHPLPRRDESRLLVVDRRAGSFSHHHFPALLKFLRAGDLVVMNDSKVIPARLHAMNVSLSRKFEVLLLEENGKNDWWAMMRPGKRAPAGTELVILKRDGVASAIHGKVVDVNNDGHRRIAFTGTSDVMTQLRALGEVPLPPYIERMGQQDMSIDEQRYQTVYAKTPGSVAAPTAGLHFTPEILKQIAESGITSCSVTLHVGPGTFAPVKAENIVEHHMHEERFEIAEETAALINKAKAERRRVVAIGTTTLRVLESATRQAGDGANGSNYLIAGSSRTGVFIYPPHDFKIVDSLLTNFHLPKSTLLMLVSAFAAPGNTSGRALILDAYEQAIAKGYRFFSYGDAMLLA